MTKEIWGITRHRKKTPKILANIKVKVNNYNFMKKSSAKNSVVSKSGLAWSCHVGNLHISVASEALNERLH